METRYFKLINAASPRRTWIVSALSANDAELAYIRHIHGAEARIEGQRIVWPHPTEEGDQQYVPRPLLSIHEAYDDGTPVEIAAPDCVYYWLGGRVAGKWRQAMLVSKVLGGTARSLAELRSNCIMSGQPAVYGVKAHGAPPGIPSDEAFKEVNQQNPGLWPSINKV